MTPVARLASTPAFLTLVLAMALAGCTGGGDDDGGPGIAPGFHLCEPGPLYQQNGMPENPHDLTAAQLAELDPPPEAARHTMLTEEQGAFCDDLAEEEGVLLLWYKYGSDAAHETAVGQLTAQGCASHDVLVQGREITTIGSGDDDARARVRSAVLDDEPGWDSAC